VTRAEAYLRETLGPKRYLEHRRRPAWAGCADHRFLLHYVTLWLYILEDDGRSYRFYAALASTEEGDG